MGEFDNYKQEILDKESAFNTNPPQVTIIFPETILRDRKTTYISNPEESSLEISSKISLLAELAQIIKDNNRSEVIILNEGPPAYFDLGNNRSKFSGTDWAYVKKYNSELMNFIPSWVHIVDVEFLACHFGLNKCYDSKFYFETKNLYAPEFLAILADETVRVLTSTKTSMKKCLVCDLDNTLWGGVIGDDGIDGIELDDISPRGHAFKEFQKQIKRLKDIGVILAIASKNEESTAMEAIKSHPDMILREDDFVNIKIDWNPKSDNILRISQELNIGLDSLVFIDDNPAEIEIVNQFLPEVTTLLLGNDPTLFLGILRNSRLFEPKVITEEDLNKTAQYKQEFQRKSLQSSVTDLNTYLLSLEMEASFASFSSMNISRISQLTQKSNQFNLTTVRRSEAEVQEVQSNDKLFSFTTNVKDKFGEYGLIGVNIFEISKLENALIVDTWLMSCRVLKRGIEQEVLNHAIRFAQARKLEKIVGVYYPTKKNVIVKDLFLELGFTLLFTDDKVSKYILPLYDIKPVKTFVNVEF